jgi:hypothetical protein
LQTLSQRPMSNSFFPWRPLQSLAFACVESSWTERTSSVVRFQFAALLQTFASVILAQACKAVYRL